MQDKAEKAGLSWTVESAGTNGYHTGDAPHPLSQKVARLHGIDISRQRARRFVADDFRQYDRIYALASDVMEEMKRIARHEFDPQKADLLMNELNPGGNQDVPDPYYGAEQGYHEVFAMISEACDALISNHARSLAS